MDAEFVFDDEGWQRILKQIKSKWDDIRKRKTFGGIISAAVYKDLITHFEQERGPNGKWEPWSKIWAERRQAMGRGGGKILQLSGKLRQGIIPKNWRGTQEGVLFYNNVVYANAHDQGNKKKHLPQRQFMYLSKSGLQSVIDQTEKWLAEGL